MGGENDEESGQEGSPRLHDIKRYVGPAEEGGMFAIGQGVPNLVNMGHEDVLLPGQSSGCVRGCLFWGGRHPGGGEF